MVKVTKVDGSSVEYAYDVEGVRVKTVEKAAGGAVSDVHGCRRSLRSVGWRSIVIISAIFPSPNRICSAMSDKKHYVNYRDLHVNLTPIPSAALPAETARKPWFGDLGFSRKPATTWFNDILVACLSLPGCLEGMDFAAFRASLVRQAAALRHIIQIGEAASRQPVSGVAATWLSSPMTIRCSQLGPLKYSSSARVGALDTHVEMEVMT